MVTFNLHLHSSIMPLNDTEYILETEVVCWTEVFDLKEIQQFLRDNLILIKDHLQAEKQSCNLLTVTSLYTTELGEAVEEGMM